MFASLSATQRGLISALFAFLAYGLWAYWSNYQHSVYAGLKAALTQGSYSFVVTLFVSFFMQGLYTALSKRLPNKQQARYEVVWLTTLITCFLLYTSSWFVNVLAGTPEIFKTVVLGYVFGTFYTVFYVLGLHRIKQNEPT